ncbi:hypothetical protein BGW38_007411, partial [Lunasporangiospora selenospora]
SSSSSSNRNSCLFFTHNAPVRPNPRPLAIRHLRRLPSTISVLCSSTARSDSIACRSLSRSMRMSSTRRFGSKSTSFESTLAMVSPRTSEG